MVLTSGGSGSSNSDRQSTTSETKSDTGQWYSLLISHAITIKNKNYLQLLASSRCSVSKLRVAPQKVADRKIAISMAREVIEPLWANLTKGPSAHL